MRFPLVVLTLAFAMACETSWSARDGGGTDASMPDASFAPDASVVLDSGTPDSGTPDSGTPDAGPPEVELFLRDGGAARGLLAARYDHRDWWWTPSSDVTWALLQADLRVRFLSSGDLAVQPSTSPLPQPQVYDHVRDAGLSLRFPLDGVATVITGHDGYHLQEDGYGDFAWDFVRSRADGGRWDNLGVFNSDYLIWDAPVYLPAAGVVIEVVDDVLDNFPGGYDAGAVNNLVGVAVRENWGIYLLHFRQHSIPRRDAGTCAPTVPGVACVEPGEFLPSGSYLGRVGNAGVSLEPHLHVTMLYFDPASGRTWSVPSEFKDLSVADSPLGPSTVQPFSVPLRGQSVSGAPF